MRYPAWKYILIVLALIVGTLYSLPNLYPDEPAVQISGANAGIKVDQTVLAQANAALKQAGLPFHGTEVQEKGADRLFLNNLPAKNTVRQVTKTISRLRLLMRKLAAG